MSVFSKVIDFLATPSALRYHARMTPVRLAAPMTIIGIAALVLAVCAPTPVRPVRALSYPLGRETDTLFVFLPGRGDRDWSFEKHGLIEDARAAGLRADILVADLHMGYYREATAIGTLHDDVIRPALEKGYRRIWLVGVSAGGLAAILHERKTPGPVSGIILLAPYLGEPERLHALSQAGGIPAHSPGTLGEPDFLSQVWLWLQSYARRTDHMIPAFAGFGTKDPYAPPQGVLEAALGRDRVVRLDGGHDWETFRKLFRILLERALGGPLAGTVEESQPVR